MIYLERLQVQDIEQTIDLAVKFNKIYGMVSQISRDKIRRMLKASLVYDKSYFALVMKDQEKIVGALVGFAAEHPYYDVVMASELGWYIEEEYRGKNTGILMLKEFESWAKTDAKADFVGMVYTDEMSDLSILYGKLGYKSVEHTYVKAIK